MSDRDKSRESNAQIALLRVKVSRKARGCELKLNSTNRTERIRRFTIHKTMMSRSLTVEKTLMIPKTN